ncbi:MAG: hypothetical protein JXR07_16655 [Reichenbachiella sp.]
MQILTQKEERDLIHREIDEVIIETLRQRLDFINLETKSEIKPENKVWEQEYMS